MIMRELADEYLWLTELLNCKSAITRWRDQSDSPCQPSSAASVRSGRKILCARCNNLDYNMIPLTKLHISTSYQFHPYRVNEAISIELPVSQGRLHERKLGLVCLKDQKHKGIVGSVPRYCIW